MANLSEWSLVPWNPKLNGLTSERITRGKDQVPFLCFAKPFDDQLKMLPYEVRQMERLFQLLEDTEWEDVEVSTVAELLHKYEVPKVALNACLSSYTQRTLLRNMSQIFIRHGVSHVAAMSYQVLERTAETFFKQFYEAHILNGETFQNAAAHGRDALRADDYRATHSIIPTNYHNDTRSLSNDFFFRPGHLNKNQWRVVARMAMSQFMWLVAKPIDFLGTRITYAFPFEVLKSRTEIALSRSDGAELRPQMEIETHSESILRVGIEHLAIEDRLKASESGGAIYLYSHDHPNELSACVKSLAKVWVLSGFLDEVDIISARIFLGILSNLDLWLQARMQRERSDVRGTVGRRRMLVIDRFDSFYPQKPGLRDEEERVGLQLALKRISALIRNYPQHEAYLIVTGCYDSDWWKERTWFNDREIKAALGRAVPHNHNVTPVTHES
jgi:CHAT domain